MTLGQQASQGLAPAHQSRLHGSRRQSEQTGGVVDPEPLDVDEEEHVAVSRGEVAERRAQQRRALRRLDELRRAGSAIADLRGELDPSALLAAAP